MVSDFNEIFDFGRLKSGRNPSRPIKLFHLPPCQAVTGHAAGAVRHIHLNILVHPIMIISSLLINDLLR